MHKPTILKNPVQFYKVCMGYSRVFSVVILVYQQALGSDIYVRGYHHL